MWRLVTQGILVKAYEHSVVEDYVRARGPGILVKAHVHSCGRANWSTNVWNRRHGTGGCLRTVWNRRYGRGKVSAEVARPAAAVGRESFCGWT